MTEQTNADKLGTDGALRAAALHEARKVLAPTSAFGSGATLDAIHVDQLVDLAEYIATGKYWTLDKVEDEPEAAQVTDAGKVGAITVPPQHNKLADAVIPSATWVAMKQAFAATEFNREVFGVAQVDPRTHREPSRWAVLHDREGDAWEYGTVDGVAGWYCPDETEPKPWAEINCEYAPFTIQGAAPSVADNLAKWRPGVDPEPRRTATLIDGFSREWEYTPETSGAQGWRIVRGARGQSVIHPCPREWSAPLMLGREFTVKAEDVKR